MLAPQTIRFCPLCAGTLGREAVPPDQREQAVCSRCRFVFYLNPKVVAGTIPEQDGRILLTRRSINPGRGLWTFPGGFVDFGDGVTGGELTPCAENDALDWLKPSEIPWPALAFPSTRDALREWVAARGETPA